VDDFISEEKLKKLVSDNTKEDLDFDKLNEEINLLYVAVTRAKNSLYIPETLMPADLQASGQIRIMGVGKEVEKQASTNRRPRVKEKIDKVGIVNSFSVEKIRKKHRAAYKPWTRELDDELTEKYREGIHVKELSKHFGRTRGAILSRIKKLELK
jgi:F-box protein, helicase, 18